MSAGIEGVEEAGTRTESDAIRRLGEGETGALAELIDRHGEDLLRYLASILGTREEAEDVFQETWIKVMQTARRFDARRDAAPWIFRRSGTNSSWPRSAASCVVNTLKVVYAMPSVEVLNPKGDTTR